MSYEISSFMWSVNLGGYEILAMGDDRGSRLVFREKYHASVLEEHGHPGATESYDVSTRGALHMEFASAHHSPEGLLKFINAHGLPFDGYNYVNRVMLAHEWMRRLVKITKAKQKGYRERAAEMVNEAPVLFRLRADFTAGISKQLTFAPTDLFGVMVLLAVGDMQGVEWRSCNWCPTMFKVDDRRGGRALYCSNNCRQRAFQAKRRKT